MEDDKILHQKILRHLRQAQSPERAISIAKACGYTSKSDVNPALYTLKQIGKIDQVPGSQPPTWKIKPKTILEMWATSNNEMLI